MLERILVPLDGSKTAEEILTRVKQLLKHEDSEVLLFRSVEFPLSPRPELIPRNEMKVEAKRYLADHAEKLEDGGIRNRILVREGAAAESILSVAAEERATLIAMTTHGRTGMQRWIFGSVAEKVVRASEIPVLAVRSFAPMPASGAKLFQKILVPIDGGNASPQVLPFVASLARRLGSVVELVFVKETLHYPPGAFAGALGGPVPVDWPQGPDPAAKLAEAAEKLEKQGIKTVTLTTGGDPASALLELAAQRGTDLIAMTTHGHTGVTRWMLGSVTEKMLRAATVPMLIVRAK